MTGVRDRESLVRNMNHLTRKYMVEFQRIEHVAQLEGQHDRAGEPDDEAGSLQDADADVKR